MLSADKKQAATELVPTKESLRFLLHMVFLTDAEFDAFCIDFFEETHRRFTNGMDATQKTNLLLLSPEYGQILERLRRYKPEQVAKYEDILKFEKRNLLWKKTIELRWKAIRFIMVIVLAWKGLSNITRYGIIISLSVSATGTAATTIYVSEFKIKPPEKENAATRIELGMVTISDWQYTYEITKTEITQAQYFSVTQKNPSFHLANRMSHKIDSSENHPVERVSMIDAAKFSNLLSVSHNFERCYEIKDDDTITLRDNCRGFRLPTEAEWEHAANIRSGEINGEDTELTEFGWLPSNSDLETHPVATKKANNRGIFDIYGNVWEWVWPNSQKFVYAKATLRGGSFSCDAVPGVAKGSIGIGRTDVGLRIVRAHYVSK